MLTVDKLRADVESGAVDTVIAAFTDMQGRLMGKRLHAEFFMDELEAGHAVEGCNYLLALDMDMDPQPGYELASCSRLAPGRCAVLGPGCSMHRLTSLGSLRHSQLRAAGLPERQPSVAAGKRPARQGVILDAE